MPDVAGWVSYGASPARVARPHRRRPRAGPDARPRLRAAPGRRRHRPRRAAPPPGAVLRRAGRRRAGRARRAPRAVDRAAAAGLGPRQRAGGSPAAARPDRARTPRRRRPAGDPAAGVQPGARPRATPGSAAGPAPATARDRPPTAPIRAARRWAPPSTAPSRRTAAVAPAGPTRYSPSSNSPSVAAWTGCCRATTSAWCRARAPSRARHGSISPATTYGGWTGR